MGSRRRRNGSRKSAKKQKTTLGDKILSCLCGVKPRVIEEEDDLPLCSKEEFRAMHDRKLRKGKQVQAVGPIDWLHPRTIMMATLYDSMIQTVGPIHWLHPRAIMVATLYDSIVICPGAPKRLLECLVFHKSLIRYVDPNPPEWYEQKLGAISYSEQSPEAAEVTEGTEIQSYSGAATEVQSTSEAAPLIHSSSVPTTEIPHSVAASEEDEEISQGLERLQSAGEAACCLNDTFEEEELEAAKAAAQEEFDQNEADLAAIHKILSSPFIKRDAMRTTETEEYKASPSPKRHGTPQAAINITANSANSRSPVARALFKFETQEERRQRYKMAAGAGDVECAKAVERASTIAGTAADSAAMAAAAARADTHTKTATEMGRLLDTMSTETGERAAQAAQKTALETVIEDTEAELAKLQRSNVASMIKLYQGMESPQHASPKIGARHSPLPQRSPLKSPLITPRNATNSFSEEGSKKGYTSRYLTAVHAATNTVSTWLQKDETLDSIPSQVEPAAVQLHDERPACKTTEEMPAVTPARRQTAVENLTFSTPSGHLYEDTEHPLWSDSFTSNRGAMQVNPEKAAKHAAAAARKAIEAAQHAHKAAIYAGLLQKGAHEDDHWRTAGKYLDTATTDSGMATFHNLLFEPGF